MNAHQIQSVTTSNVLSSPPSNSSNGGRVAFTAGLTEGASTTGVYVFEPADGRSYAVIHFDGEPWAGPGIQTLRTGVAPSLSPDGTHVAYQRRIVTFPERPEPHEYSGDDPTFCPAVLSDDVIVQLLPHGDTSLMIEAEPNPVPAPHNASYAVACAQNGRQVAFVSTCDKEGRNPDCHE